MRGLGSLRVGTTLLVGAIVVLCGACEKRVRLPAQIEQLNAAFTNQPSQDSPADSARPLIDAALAAVKTNDYASGVMALEAVRQTRGMSAEQLKAVAGTIQTLTQSLVERADRGDAAAQAALAAIERTRSQ